MEPTGRTGSAAASPPFCQKKTETVSSFKEGVSAILSKWVALQMAIENNWGGIDSLSKSHQLISDIVSWFSKSKAPLLVDDLESLLHERLLLSFNTEIEDGSIEEVAEKLMAFHDEFLNGN